MFSNLDKFSPSTKAFIEAQLAAGAALGSKLVEGSERVAALNIASAKTYTQESVAAMQQLLATKEPQQLFQLASAGSKSNAEKAAAYGRELNEIVTGLHSHFTKTAATAVAQLAPAAGNPA
jgi:phasin family protein